MQVPAGIYRLYRICTSSLKLGIEFMARIIFRFAVTLLSIMALFPLSLLLMRFGRGRICKTTKAPLSVIFLTMIISVVVFAGNIAIEPRTFE